MLNGIVASFGVNHFGRGVDGVLHGSALNGPELWCAIIVNFQLRFTPPDGGGLRNLIGDHSLSSLLSAWNRRQDMAFRALRGNLFEISRHPLSGYPLPRPFE